MLAQVLGGKTVDAFLGMSEYGVWEYQGENEFFGMRLRERGAYINNGCEDMADQRRHTTPGTAWHRRARAGAAERYSSRHFVQGTVEDINGPTGLNFLPRLK